MIWYLWGTGIFAGGFASGWFLRGAQVARAAKAPRSIEQIDTVVRLQRIERKLNSVVKKTGAVDGWE